MSSKSYPQLKTQSSKYKVQKYNTRSKKLNKKSEKEIEESLKHF